MKAYYYFCELSESAQHRAYGFYVKSGGCRTFEEYRANATYSAIMYGADGREI